MKKLRIILLIWIVNVGFLSLLNAQQVAGIVSENLSQQDSMESIENAKKPHQVQPSDKIKISVYQEEDMTGVYEVSASGRIVFPLIDEVDVLNLTIEQIQNLLTDKLKKYLVNPQVTVVFEGQSVKPIVLLGLFNTPGTFPYQKGLTLVKAIALAGDFKPTADPSKIQIIRTLMNGQTKVLPVNAVRIMSGQVADLEIYPGDMIKASEVYKPVTVDGLVNKPGVFDFMKGLTLSRMIAIAGDVKPSADTREIYLIRQKDGETLSIMTCNLMNIMEGKDIDPEIFSGDVIRVTKAYKPITIIGSVHKPGTFDYAPKATLLKMIAMAGDLKDVADPKRINIIRTLEQGQKKTIQVNLINIFNGKAVDPEIFPGDIIKVRESFF